MFIDMMGGVFSVLSLVFKTEFDVIAGITYSLVVVCLYLHREELRQGNADGLIVGIRRDRSDTGPHPEPNRQAAKSR